MRDEVDELQAQWRLSRPGLDLDPAGVFPRIFRISRLSQELTDAALTGHGIDRPGFEVLSFLIRSGHPVQPHQIADDLHMTRAAITKRLRQIEDAGLVVRRPHGHDGRGIVIEPTDRGRALAGPVIDAIAALESSWLSSMPAAERAALEPALRHLLAALVTAKPPA